MDQIRRFHRDFYRPENLCLIVGGKWEDATPLLPAVLAFEDKILGKRARDDIPPYQRPWTDESLIPQHAPGSAEPVAVT